MGAYLTIAFRNMLQAKRRTILLTLALSIVTMLLMIMLSVSQGLSETMIRNATAISSGHVNVAGFYKSKPTEAWPMITGVDKIRKIAEENTPGLDHIVDRDRAWAKIISDRHSFYASPSGIDIEDETRLPEVLKLAKESEYKEGGRDEVFGDLSKLSQKHSALIFVSQAKRLGVEVGDYLTITAPTGSGRTNTLDVTVAAIAKDFGYMSNWNLFLPKEDIHELYQTKPDSSSVVMIYLKDPSKAEEVMGHLREVYKKAGYRLMDHQPAPFFFKFETVAGEDWTGQKLDLTIWSDEISFLSWVTTALDGISFSLIGVLMVIIAVGIMNSMWISVRERTQEIGTVRAIGMTRSKVLMMFLSEMLLLGLFATTLGSLAGAWISLAIDAAAWEISNEAIKAIMMSDVLHMSVTPWQVVHVIWIFTLITGLSAIWPASRAARMQPVTAIHHAG
ncbi:MAG: ABC transporter permease [Deltaproteobacteria bacterium]|nr:ABC transporter permease [Deltaproteobacteria bacterium]